MEVPLFPLRTVLFPGMSLPLRIFEERYKTMVRELLETRGSFGVVLIRSGQEVGGGAVPHKVGTLARITECEEVQGGRFVLTARGTRRFSLLKMLLPRPYPYGEIEMLDESFDPANPRLISASETVRATFPSYFRLALSRTGQWARDMDLPSDPRDLVNVIMQSIQAEEDAKQRVLELEAAADQVSHLADMIDDLLVHTREEVNEYRRQKFHGLGAAN
jgi:Lon protease-like protein